MLPVVVSSTPTSAVARRGPTPDSEMRLRRSSAFPGACSSRTSRPRVWRSRLMILAASRSWPSTSPTTSATSRSVMGTTSYQSPPTSMPDRRGQVAGRDVPALDARDGVGQHVALQLVGDPALAVVGPGPADDRADLRGQLLGHAEVLLGEAAPRPGRDEGDRAEHALGAQPERDGHVRGETELLEDGVVPVVPAGRLQEPVVHERAPHGLAAAHDLDDRMGAAGVGRVLVAQLLGQRPLAGVGVPGGHPLHLPVLVLDVDQAQVRHHRDRDLGQALHHLAVVDDLGEHLRRQEQELVAPPGLEELVDQLLALGGLGRGVQQLAQVTADRIHELDDRGVALALLAAQHLDHPDARPPVADREGVGAAGARRGPARRS